MDELRSSFVTFMTCAILLIAYAINGPTLSANYLDTLPESLAAVLRHGDLMHLSGNILVIFFGGLIAEKRLGAARLTLLMLTCAIIGTLAQYMIAWPPVHWGIGHFIWAVDLWRHDGATTSRIDCCWRCRCHITSA